jgi:NAD dependent epimerase/dehydratase family enzyme
MSWIHIEDHIGLTQHLLGSPKARGPYNATAPNPVTNAEFTHELAKYLHRRALLPIPAWLLKLAMGEMAELLLGSQRVIPKKALDSGFRFSYETLEPALSEVLADDPDEPA